MGSTFKDVGEFFTDSAEHEEEFWRLVDNLAEMDIAIPGWTSGAIFQQAKSLAYDQFKEANAANAAATLPDSGERSQFQTGAVRDAMAGKGFFSMIPPAALRAIAKRFEDGAKKYEPHNWMKGIPLGRYFDAMIRHAISAAEGDESEDHFGAMLWNAACWLWTEEAIKAGRLPKELDNLPFRGRGE